jgi:hypothetical protein
MMVSVNKHKKIKKKAKDLYVGKDRAVEVRFHKR